MSFNEKDNIDFSNYEEWFVLYLDDELCAEQKKLVDEFLGLHPHLKEEWNLLQATKLPAADTTFAGKDALLSPSMKLHVVDEALLLYIDNELPAVERKAIEEKIVGEPEYTLQYRLLQLTKVDATEHLACPNKKDLYRHSGKVTFFPVWLRIAAVLLLLLTGLYFLKLNQHDQAATSVAISNRQAPSVAQNPATQTAIPAADLVREKVPAAPMGTIAKSTGKKKTIRKIEEKELVMPALTNTTEPIAATESAYKPAIVEKAGAIQVAVRKLSTPPAAFNNSVAALPVTPASLTPLHRTEAPEELIVTDGDDKPGRTPAKGFFRKVSRFIERRTGIGTVNANNELWVGAVALKLN